MNWSPRLLPFIVSNDLLQDTPSLQARMREQGYLFLKDVSPRDPILRLRRDMLALCRQAGWVVESDDPL